MRFREESIMTECNATTIHIATLGDFDVTKKDHSLVQAAPTSKKLWELYKFMLTNRNRKFTPEALADQLWVSESYSDSRSTLRRQMHRLRELLNENYENDTFTTILFVNGYYHWNPALNVSVDVDEFENLIKDGDCFMADEHVDEAITSYLAAIDLYKGEYLPDLTNQHWVFSIRNHYKRHYMETVLKVSNLLFEKEDTEKIIEICAKAIEIDVYEEVFHIYYMKALNTIGNKKEALLHYEQITGFYYRELGLKPSDDFRTLYKTLLQSTATMSSDLKGLSTLEVEEDDKAFFCEVEVFKSIYELDLRRSKRSNKNFAIGLFHMNGIEKNSTSQEMNRMNHFKQHLYTQLRKGDTFALWSDYQFIVLLHDIPREETKNVLARLIESYPHKNEIAIDHIEQLQVKS